MNKHEAEELARVVAKRLFEEAETKRVFKEALQEWMDKKFLEFSKSSLQGIAILLFGAMLVFVMWSQGYTKP